MQALILVGHGSHLSASSSEPVYRHAAEIRRRGLFDEVRECFWKEEPSLRVILDLVESPEVFVVPVFISEGYFTGEVVPRELGLDGPAPSVTRVAGRRVHYCAPVGTHPWMTRMILRRAEETAGLSDEAARRAGLVIIGHGTERNAQSATVIHRVTGEARAAGVFGRVEAGFLDQEPGVGAVLAGMDTERVVLVPFFVAEGWHTQETIPDDLGIHRPSVSSVTERDGRFIHYAAPVGTFPEVADIVVQRAREAGARLPEPSVVEPRGAPGAHGGSVADARAALLAWVDAAGPAGRRFLEAHLVRTPEGGYRLRHAADAARPAEELTRLLDPYDARDIARTTASGAHRPLRTAPDLRRGWTFEALDGRGLWTALDYLYPACALHWHAARSGTLRVTPWKRTAARQSGIYASVGLLPEGVMPDVVDACCGDAVCLRRVAWRPADAGQEDMAAEPGAARVPCPEACSIFVAFARQALELERAPRVEVPGLGALAPEEVEGLRAVVRAAAEGTLGAARTGDFEEPTNPRRIRYLAARLAHGEPVL